MDERLIYAAGGVVIGAAAAVGATYVWFQKRFETELAEALDRELEATKKFYANLQKVDYPTPEDLVRERGLKFEFQMNEKEIYQGLVGDSEYGGEAEEAAAVVEELAEVTKNVFANFADTETWDADKEEATRDPAMPYVISHDEFFENAPEHIQTQLTYFEEDGVIADSEDKPVDESVVGEDNLDRFGDGSRDPNIVYVRNEAMDIDFEILRVEGKYADQVMGFLKHEDTQIRKFRLNEE